MATRPTRPPRQRTLVARRAPSKGWHASNRLGEPSCGAWVVPATRRRLSGATAGCPRGPPGIPVGGVSGGQHEGGGAGHGRNTFIILLIPFMMYSHAFVCPTLTTHMLAGRRRRESQCRGRGEGYACARARRAKRVSVPCSCQSSKRHEWVARSALSSELQPSVTRAHILCVSRSQDFVRSTGTRSRILAVQEYATRRTMSVFSKDTLAAAIRRERTPTSSQNLLRYCNKAFISLVDREYRTHQDEELQL